MLPLYTGISRQTSVTACKRYVDIIIHSLNRTL